jgi:secreted protein with Ig-like and vWFA domain
VAGDKATEYTERVGEMTPQGGTDLSAALDLGYETALKHYQVGSVNRVVLLTDGAANLGDVKGDALKAKVEAHRKQGIAFDCFGVGWEGYNDDLLEELSRNGDGRYGFINTPEAAATEFAGQLAGALRVAASDVKVQVEFNPKRVQAYRQVGYAKHQLKKEQFRDNTVDAAEIGAAESGNALYVIDVNPRGEGDIATARARFKVPGTSDYREHEWVVPFKAPAPAIEQASSSLRLATTAAAFAESLAQSPYAAEVTSDRLLSILNGIPAIYGADSRPAKLEAMIRQAKSLSGR